MQIEAGQFFQAGVWVYAVCWLIPMLVRMVMVIRRGEDVNLFKYDSMTGFMSLGRNLGWILIFIVSLLCVFVFPSIDEVTYTNRGDASETYSYIIDPEERALQISREGYSTRRFYVPFTYDGHYCAPFASYFYNNTNATLVFYRAEYYLGRLNEIADESSFIEVTPGYFGKPIKPIDHSFANPGVGYFSFINKKKNKNPFTVEWTLDLPECARIEIKNLRQQMTYGVHHTYPIHQKSLDSILLERARSYMDENRSVKIAERADSIIEAYKKSHNHGSQQ